MARTLHEMLKALEVSDASAVVFGKLVTAASRGKREALVFPTGDTSARIPNVPV